MRETDPLRALELWKALVRGRWSTVDWFDVDGRRYVIGIPNAPGLDDPRGLTDREMQVVAYVYAGLTNKMIGYHLGLSEGRISGLLSSAMHKLKVQNRAQLVKRMKDFEGLTRL
jgi:DNA-binding NarL/FixJ family response regulator